jgi:hypothetical protein
MEVHHFRGGGQGRMTFEEIIKVSKFVAFKCVPLVKPLGSFLSHLVLEK